MEFDDYNIKMKEILSRYHDTIELEMIPKLKDSFTKLYMGITELQGKLKAKGLIKDDPYMKTTEFTDIVVPPSDTYIESDESWKSDERFYQYVSILSFIIHNYNLSLGNLSLPEIEKIKRFLDYYQWKGLMNPATTDFNTKILGKKAISLRSSINDRLVLSTIDKCIENIETSYNKIMELLKYIFLYIKESYKQFIRGDIIPLIDNDGLEYSQIDLLKKVKKEIDSNYSYLKFYKKYIGEVLDEDFSKEGSSLKNENLKKFSQINMVKASKQKDEKEAKGKLLVDLLLEIGKTRKHLNLAIEKINENHINLSTKSGSFISRFFRFLSTALFNINPKTQYKINIPSGKEGKSTSLILHYEKFYETVKHTEFVLLPFSEEDRAIAYIESLEGTVTKEIDKILLEIKREIKNLIGLDEFLKIELKAKSLKSRGIKPEITVLKTIMNSSTKLYREVLDYL